MLAKVPFRLAFASFHPSLTERKQAIASWRSSRPRFEAALNAERSSSTSSFASPAALRLPSNRAKEPSLAPEWESPL
jgi:hypothetical protein